MLEIPKDVFIISIATYDGRAVPKSIGDLYAVGALLGRRVFLNVQQGTGVPRIRNKCIKAVKEAFPGAESAYMFWLDSDIVLNENPEKIAEYVTKAEAGGLSFTGNYSIIDSANQKIFNCVEKEDNTHFTNEELAAAKPFELRVRYSGMGLGYIKMPLDYELRTSGDYGADFLFFKDNPAIDLRYAPIANFHIKNLWIPGK